MDNQRYSEKSDATEPDGHRAGLVAGLLGGLILGGLVGAVSMLMLAPQSGKKTRVKLQRQGRDLRDQATDVLEEAIDLARSKAQSIAHDIGEQAEKLEQRGQAMLPG